MRVQRSAPGHWLVAAGRVDAYQQSGDGGIGAVEDGPARRRLDRGEGAGRRRVLLATDPQRRLTFEDYVNLVLTALGLVVLGDLSPRRDLDQVEAEGRLAQGLARQAPGRVSRPLHDLELVAVPDRVAVRHQAAMGAPTSSLITRFGAARAAFAAAISAVLSRS